MRQFVSLIWAILIFGGTAAGQTIPSEAADRQTPVPATQPVMTGIPKGAIGAQYIDGSFGFGIRPLAGATIDRYKRSVEGRTQLAQFVRLDIGWSMSVRLWVADRPVDVPAARQDMGAKLVLQYPDLSIIRAEPIQIANRHSVRLAGIFSAEGQSWLRQQAVIPLRGKTYILVVLTTPADDKEIASEAFGQILESFQVVRTEVQQQQLDTALDRGTALLKTLAESGTGVASKASPITYLRTTQDGKPVGFVEIEEQPGSVGHKKGLRISQRAWLFGEDGGTQYLQDDKFVADDWAYDEWRNLSQILPSKNVDPKPRLVVSIEGGVRQNDQLVVEFSNQVGMTEKKDKAIHVENSYAPAAWPLLVSRLVDLNKPELYAFSMYDTGRRGMVLRVFRVLGSTQVTISGRSTTAYRIEDSEGLVPPISMIDVDEKGRLLRLASGSVEMSVSTKAQIEEEFGQHVKATIERLREISGLPPTSPIPNAPQPSGNAQSGKPSAAGKAPAGKSRTKSSPFKRPANKKDPKKSTR